MIDNKTFNNAIDTLKQLGEEHHQINTTTTGDIWKIDLDSNGTLFPLFHINPINVTTGESQLNMSFQLFVMEVVYDTTQHAEVLSECLSICTDIIGVFRHSAQQGVSASGAMGLVGDISNPIYFTDGEFTLEPFNERFDNELTGWVFNLGVLVPNTFQTCEIPMSTDYIGK